MNSRLCVALLLLGTSLMLAKQYSEAELQALFIKRPPPDYPYPARLRHHTGSGMFRLFVDEQGKVSTIKVLKSTGQPELDKAALFALVHWQAKPGVKREVDLPITFTVAGR